jgi:hypothetical protein
MANMPRPPTIKSKTQTGGSWKNGNGGKWASQNQIMPDK